MLPPRSQPTRVITQASLREAGAEFVRGTSYGWGRRELASWLLCHYSPCVVVDAAIKLEGDHSEALRRALDRLDDERIERLILDARSGVLKMLSGFTWQWQAKAITQSAIASGSVVTVRDTRGGTGYAPAFRERMRLTGRVASLFVADALNCPQRYRKVTFCRQCGELGFSAPVEHSPSCDTARRVA